MIGGENWFYFQAMQYEQNETQIPIGGERKMFTEQWMLDEIIAHGWKAFEHYTKLYESMPTCKNEYDSEKYQDCIVEKCNCCYEKTREFFLRK